ncbi:hypothetical protein [Microbulbifer hainanensis]|uniref:hypothetical protein n=1 Tax=Microbulbifer hainanensis TaxID=2735675 RepID=UPI001D0054ED|nr:hypothetical protein [Microbulbifer hainanensis]
MAVAAVEGVADVFAAQLLGIDEQLVTTPYLVAECTVGNPVQRARRQGVLITRFRLRRQLWLPVGQFLGPECAGAEGTGEK